MYVEYLLNNNLQILLYNINNTHLKIIVYNYNNYQECKQKNIRLAVVLYHLKHSLSRVMVMGHNDGISCLGFYDLNVFAHIIIL